MEIDAELGLAGNRAARANWISITGWQRVFLSDIDTHKAVLDAAMYADDNQLWNAPDGTADVPVTNGPTGVDGKTGQLVNGITVSRNRTGFVHGWPNEVP